jgi:hypothetical protein
MVKEKANLAGPWSLYAKYMIKYKRVDLLVDLYDRFPSAKNCIIRSALQFDDLGTLILFCEKPGPVEICHYGAFNCFTRESNECLKYLIKNKIFPEKIKVTMYNVKCSYQ